MKEIAKFKALDNQVLTPIEAGKLLNCGADAVRYLHRIGRLDAIRTPGGLRLFLRQQVEQLALERSGNSQS